MDKACRSSNTRFDEIKVFHGLSEVAGQAYYSVKGLRRLGVSVSHVLWKPNPAKYEYDLSFDIDLKKKYLIPIWMIKLLYYEATAIKTIDVFHFHFGRSLLFNYDLSLLKALGKKVFFEFHGSDVRDCSLANKRNPYMFFSQTDKERERLKRRAKKICSKADGIILHDDELIEHLPSKSEKIYVVPLRVDIDRIEPNYIDSSKQRIRIVHAPTNREVKGTKYVLDAVERLKNKYSIELILVEGKTQKEAFEIYKTADIIVDQIKIGTYGVFAIESMAMGKPVITYITDDMKQNLPEELPICSANPDTIESVLEQLIIDGDLRLRLGQKGRKYVEKYHDYKKNAKMLNAIYLGKINPIRGRAAFEYASKIVL